MGKGARMADRRRTDVAAGRVVNFTPRENGFMPPFDAVTSVSVVPFTDDGRLVAVLLDRGIDLPGGHVQEGERTVEEVARREAYEEARIALRNVHVTTVIQSDYYGSAPKELTYMVQAAAFVDRCTLLCRPWRAVDASSWASMSSSNATQPAIRV